MRERNSRPDRAVVGSIVVGCIVVGCIDVGSILVGGTAAWIVVK